MNSPETIYLDYAAATPLDGEVLAAMQPYFSEKFFNPSSPYAPAVEVRRDYDDAKARLAHTFGATGGELVMTAGATESVNLAFQASHGHVVTSSIEHPAVLEAAKKGSYTLVEPNEKGRIAAEAIRAALTPETTLVSIGLANSELGTIQPLRHIAAIIEEERQNRVVEGNTTPLLFHSDASQGFGLVDIHVARLGVDMLTLNAGKIYGPKQVGVLWRKPSVRLTANIVGGGQEMGLRSGTENVPGVVGFAKAAELAVRKREQESARLQKLRDGLEKKLLEAMPDMIISGDKKHRLASHLHVSFPGIDAERLVFLLETKEVFVATGSACAANKHTASHVLIAIGCDESVINGSLRLTLGRDSDEVQIAKASEAIIAAVHSEIERMGHA